jgi:hypothetical protein
MKLIRRRLRHTEQDGDSVWTWWEPAVGLCDCGTEVVLATNTNTCDGCGVEYNAWGQKLAPRSQWGWETGEHSADVARWCR